MFVVSLDFYYTDEASVKKAKYLLNKYAFKATFFCLSNTYLNGFQIDITYIIYIYIYIIQIYIAIHILLFSFLIYMYIYIYIYIYINVYMYTYIYIIYI